MILDIDYTDYDFTDYKTALEKYNAFEPKANEFKELIYSDETTISDNVLLKKSWR